jgi:hypothetical protein
MTHSRHAGPASIRRASISARAWYKECSLLRCWNCGGGALTTLARAAPGRRNEQGNARFGLERAGKCRWWGLLQVEGPFALSLSFHERVLYPPLHVKHARFLNLVAFLAQNRYSSPSASFSGKCSKLGRISHGKPISTLPRHAPRSSNVIGKVCNFLGSWAKLGRHPR